jgi:hypothetical protein|tara:strand:- start:384 stop:515 length:132 start_codon:yes stop_codon:yes gene_type:complete
MKDESTHIVVESTARYQQGSARPTDLPTDGEDVTISINPTSDY